jgi:putative effector of murein hydrolase
MEPRTQVGSRTPTYHYFLLLVSAIVLTVFLFFLDEGHYNFEWMSNPGNWIPFFIYVAVLYLAQYLVSETVLKSIQGIHRTTLSIAGGGVLLALLIIIFGMFTHW